MVDRGESPHLAAHGCEKQGSRVGEVGEELVANLGNSRGDVLFATKRFPGITAGSVESPRSPLASLARFVRGKRTFRKSPVPSFHARQTSPRWSVPKVANRSGTKMAA